MTDMIERMARAIYESAPDAFENRTDVTVTLAPWLELPAHYRENFLKQARAAIEAMREPTEAMAEAGMDPVTTGLHDDLGSEAMAVGAYRAMIDAAINGPS